MILCNKIGFYRVIEMRNSLLKKHLQTALLLLTGLLVNQVSAGWSDASSHGIYNQRFGDFPPLDIDQQLQDSMNRHEAELKEQQSEKKSTGNTNSTGSTYQTDSAVKQVPIQQDGATKPYQNPAVGGVNNLQGVNTTVNNSSQKNQGDGKKKKKKKHKKKKSGFDFPWGNNNNGFSFPWSNSGSGFNAPWNNRRSSHDRPWDSRGKQFNPPWDNNNSSFSFPWNDNNNGFSFGPWGNDRRHHR